MIQSLHDIPPIQTNNKIDHHVLLVAPTPKTLAAGENQFEIGANKFIKVYGKPPRASDTISIPNEQIMQSPEPNEVVDVLDASNEEPFTLESLESLIQLHWAMQLDFIIARVTTMDPGDESRLYYSYYAAHHINKVLFRTQPDVGLLHRMKAKNPLNNMTIVGDVHYYIVKAKSQAIVERSKSPFEVLADIIQSIDSPKTARTKLIRAHFGYKSNQPDSQLQKVWGDTSSGPLQFLIRPELYEIDIDSKDSNSTHGRRNSFDDAFKDDLSHDQPKTVSKQLTKGRNHRKVRSIAYSNANSIMTVDDWIKEQKNKSPVMSNYPKVDPESPRKRHIKPSAIPLRDIFYEAHYYASDDDFLMHSGVRQYFKKHVIESTDAILFSIQSSNTDAEGHPAMENLALLFGDESSRSMQINISKKRIGFIIVAYALVSFLILKFLSTILLISISIILAYCRLISIFLLVPDFDYCNITYSMIYY